MPEPWIPRPNFATWLAREIAERRITNVQHTPGGTSWDRLRPEHDPDTPPETGDGPGA